MNIKIKLLALSTLLFAFTPMLHAQEVDEDYDDADTEEVSVGTEEIELPEGMIINTDSLVSSWKASHFLVADTGCNYSSEVPVYSREEYIDRLRRMPTVMEMPHNDIVQKFIDQYTGRLRRSVSFMLGASNFYIPIFEEALDRYGLPLELRYLPIIESALDPIAKSHAGASGLWQFMIGTARRYGLNESSLVDERRDPVKSSDAAARYLRDLYAIYGDWNLVIAAYNCGPGNVEKAIRRAGKRDYWEIYQYLPKETRGYVPAFIAANYVMYYYNLHNICPMQATLPLTTDTISLSRDVYMEQIADLCHIDIAQVRALNPQYKTNLIPGSSHQSTLRLPLSALNAFIDAKEAVYTYNLENLQVQRSVVDVPLSAYTASSSSSSSSRTSSSRTTRTTRTTKAKAKKTARTASVTVRKGQTLSEIARRNGTTVAKIRKLNGIKGNNIQPGKKLRVK